MATVATTGRPRLADHKVRPTIVLLTSRRPESSPGGVLSVVIAVASTLMWATMLQYILGPS